jgi:hypothetical protein
VTTKPTNDQRYRYGPGLGAAVLMAIVGLPACNWAAGLDPWWLKFLGLSLAAALVVAGVGIAAGELAKPCRPVVDETAGIAEVPTIPRTLRGDDRGPRGAA